MAGVPCDLWQPMSPAAQNTAASNPDRTSRRIRPLSSLLPTSNLRNAQRPTPGCWLRPLLALDDKPLLPFRDRLMVGQVVVDGVLQRFAGILIDVALLPDFEVSQRPVGERRRHGDAIDLACLQRLAINLDGDDAPLLFGAGVDGRSEE